MKTLLVTGTDTDVGKTWVSCAVLRHLQSAGLSAGAYKPVCSGAVPADDGLLRWNDVDLLAAAVGGNVRPDLICPQRFLAPVAPNVAAALENRSVDDRLLASGLQAWQGRADYVVVEGAGGLLCPLSDTTTVADLATRLNCPLLIVAANRLGVISHTLLTVETAVARGLSVAAVILNDCSPPTPTGDVSRESNQQQLIDRLPNVPVYRCPYGEARIEAVRGMTEFVATECFR